MWSYLDLVSCLRKLFRAGTTWFGSIISDVRGGSELVSTSSALSPDSADSKQTSCRQTKHCNTHRCKAVFCTSWRPYGNISVEASIHPLHLFPSSPQSALSPDVCTLIRNEPTWADPPLQCQKTGREKNMVGCSRFAPHRPKIHWWNTLHELTQRREASFTTVWSSFSRGASRFRSLSPIRKPWDRRTGDGRCLLHNFIVVFLGQIVNNFIP